jgi:hypothetical protein
MTALRVWVCVVTYTLHEAVMSCLYLGVALHITICLIKKKKVTRLLVLTSVKIRRSIQKRMVESYPDVTFSFNETKEEARSEQPRADDFIT